MNYLIMMFFSNSKILLTSFFSVSHEKSSKGFQTAGHEFDFNDVYL